MVLYLSIYVRIYASNAVFKEDDIMYNYTFPAVRGIQAGAEYYVTMVPCKYLSKL